MRSKRICMCNASKRTHKNLMGLLKSGFKRPHCSSFVNDFSGNFSWLPKILCEKCAKNINDCHPKPCMGALDQKNNISGSYKRPLLSEKSPPKTACFNRIYSKTQNSPTNILSAIRKPDHIFPDGPEIPVVSCRDLKIA